MIQRRRLIAFFIGWLCALACGTHSLELEVSSMRIPANGISTRDIHVLGASGPVRFHIAEGEDLVTLVTRGPEKATLRAGARPGRVRLIGTDDRSSETIVFTLHPDPSDRDEDGFPDVAELQTEEERAAFRTRFVAVARSQRPEPDSRWHPDQRDCAGLVRYAYRQALRADISPRASRYVQSEGPAGWGRIAFAFPDIPYLEDRPFRVRDGAFSDDENRDTVFDPFANAQNLLFHNTDPLGKNVTVAESGDLLFFFHPENQDQPYHVMIFFRRQNEDWLVYHTGTDVSTPGRLKEVPMNRLGEHPDPSWHPRVTNENFLGYYRFKILS
jgi:uncharacterized protein YfaT (DUF1175 family)